MQSVRAVSRVVETYRRKENEQNYSNNTTNIHAYLDCNLLTTWPERGTGRGEVDVPEN
jgi:hypothetical protein